MKYEVKSGEDLSESFEGWLWEEAKLFPRGELSMVIGHDGVGKTSMICQMAAQWTREDEVVFMAMLEDGEEIIKSKLSAYDADLDMCVFQPDRPDGAHDTHWMVPDDLEKLEIYLRISGATVCILDSLDAHMSASPISHKARIALAAVHNMAQRLRIPVIFLHHFNKGGTKTSIDQAIGGARGIKAAFRNIVVWGDFTVSDEFEGGSEVKATHALAVHKNSYGPRYPERATMIYTSKTVQHPYRDNESVLQFNLVDSTHLISPSDIYSSRHEKNDSVKAEYVTGRDIATDTILKILDSCESEDGWLPASELEEGAVAAGVCVRTVRGTRAAMGRHGLIERKKTAEAWYWRLTKRGHEHIKTLEAKQSV